MMRAESLAELIAAFRAGGDELNLFARADTLPAAERDVFVALVVADVAERRGATYVTKELGAHEASTYLAAMRKARIADAGELDRLPRRDRSVLAAIALRQYERTYGLDATVALVKRGGARA